MLCVRVMAVQTQAVVGSVKDRFGGCRSVKIVI